MNLRAILLATCLASANAVAAPAPGGYQLLKKISIKGNGGYDYLAVDQANRRVYVTHGSDVAVLDVDTLATVGTLTGLKEALGVTFVPDLHKGYITNGASHSITAFDTASLKTTAEVRSTGKGPDAVTYDPASHMVFVFNHASGNVTVIDPATDKVTATIKVGGELEFGQADGKGNLWVNIEDKAELVRIDSKTMAVTARWPLPLCKEPRGLAFDGKNRRLFSGCANGKMLVVDADSGKVVATLPIGTGVDATHFDATTGDILNSCGVSGTLVVIHQESADKYVVTETVATQKSARTLAIDPKTHRVFLSVVSPGPSKGSPLPDSFAVLVFERPAAPKP